MSSVSTQAEQAGRRAHQSEWLDHAARIGLIAYGVVHLVIGWLAVQLALGDKEGSADSQGAVQQLAEQPFGQALVWAVAIGMFLLALWQALEALFGYRDEEGFTQVRKRVTAAGKAVVYTVIGISAVHAATGPSTSKKNGTDSTTAKVMDWPGGQAIVAAVGLAIIGIGGTWSTAPSPRSSPSTSTPRARAARPARPTCGSARSATPPRGSRSASSARCSSTPASATTRRSRAGSTRRCTRCSSSRSGRSC